MPYSRVQYAVCTLLPTPLTMRARRGNLCVRAFVRACVRAYVRACVRTCAFDFLLKRYRFDSR